jgi:Spy/CpxP family protein refolding chaperone
MKKYLASLAILASAYSMAASAHGQAAGTTTTPAIQIKGSQKGNRVNAQKVLWSVLDQLKATEDQKTKIKEIAKANMKEVSELRKSVKAGTLTKEDAKEKNKELHKSLLSSIKSVLTAEQAKQFEPLLKEEMKKAREEKKEEAAGTTTKSGGG